VLAAVAGAARARLCGDQAGLDGAGRWGGGEAAEAGTTVFSGHPTGHFLCGVDDFVEGDERIKTSQCDVCAGEGV